MISIKNKDDDFRYLDKYKSYKNNINNICDNTNVIDIIDCLAFRTNIIMFNLYSFLKIYFSHLFHNKQDFPIITKDLLRYSTTFCSSINSERKCKTRIDSLSKFNDEIFSKTNPIIVSRDNLTNILSYEFDIMITCIENNITVNINQHLRKYFNIVFNYKQKITLCKNKEEVKNFKKMINLIFNDIVSTEPIQSDLIHKDFIENQKKFLFGHLDVKSIKKNKYLYDAQVSPQKYLYTFFQIINFYEKYNKENPDNKSLKLFSVLPARSSLVPCYVTLDSEILIANFKDILKTQLHKFKNVKTYEDLRRKFKNENNQAILWKLIFNTDTKPFKPKRKHKFCYIIKTDGVGVSIMFIENDKFGISKFQKGKQSVKKTKKVVEKKELYIENAVKGKNFNNKQKNIVCIDPNKRDLIYSGKYENNKFVKFRYTQNQRRVETKKKKYSKYLDAISKTPLIVDKKNKQVIKNLKIKKEEKEKKRLEKLKKLKEKKEKEDEKILKESKEKINKEIKEEKKEKSKRQQKREAKKPLKSPEEFDNKLMEMKKLGCGIKTSIKELETLKSIENKKILDIEKLKLLIKDNNSINEMLLESYKMKIYRKLKLNIKINTQKSEGKMIKNFKEKMGSKEKIIVIIGNYSCGSYNMKGLESAISKRIIKLFTNVGYECYLIDEYNTSKLCNECEEELEKFHKRENKKPTKFGEIELVHGILRCQSLTHSEIYHNRDKNAVKNMLKITINLMEKKERPLKYQRNCEIK